MMPRKPSDDRSYPTLNQVKATIRKSARGILYDSEGRLYGFIPDSVPLVQVARELNELKQNQIAMWVALMQHRKGRGKSRDKDNTMYVSDELLFPREGDTITLYDYTTKEPTYHITILSFPEWNQHGSQRSTSIFVSISQKEHDV